MAPRSKQPSDLPGVVPGGKREAENEAEIAATAAKMPTPQPSASLNEASDEADPAASAGAEEPSPEVSLTPEQDAAIAQLADSDYGIEAPNFDDLTPEQQAAIDTLAGNEGFLEEAEQVEAVEFANEEEIANERGDQIGIVKELKARAIQNLGRNVNEEKSLISKALGSDFEVTSKGNELFFRKKGSKKFFPIDRKSFSGGLREFVGDLVDFSGEGLEAGTSVVAAAKGAVAGAAAGTAAFPGAGTLAGGVAGGVAAAGAAGLAATAAREIAIRAFEGETSTDLAKELTWNTGLNLATLGMGALVKGAGKKVLSSFQETLEMAPMKRVEELAEVRVKFEAVSETVMGKHRPGSLAKGEVGDRIYGAIEALDDRLDKALNFTRKQSIMDLGGMPKKVDNYAQAIEAQLESMGIPKTMIPQLGDPKLYRETLEYFKRNKALGDEVMGAEFGKKLIDEYLSINKTGGMSMQNVWNTLDWLKQPAGYKNGAKVEYPTAAMAKARELRRALAVDRNEILATSYSKSDPKTSSFMMDAMKEYTEKVDTIVQFKKIFKSSKESAEKFTDAIVRPNNSQQVRDFRNLVGAESEEFALLQAEWFDRIFRETLTDVGTVDPLKLKKTMAKYGDEVVDEMLSKTQRHALEAISQKAAKIPYFDIINATQRDKQVVQDMAAIGLLGQKHPGPVIRLFWNMLGSNADAAKYLADDGLLELAAKTADPGKQSLILKITQSFRKMLDATDIVDKNGRKMLQPIDFDARLQDPAIQKVLLDTQSKMRSDAAKKGIRLPGAGAMLGAQAGRMLAPQNAEKPGAGTGSEAAQ